VVFITIMAETLLLESAIQMAVQIYQLCEDEDAAAAETNTKKSLAAAGRKMINFATVLRSFPPEYAASPAVSLFLQELKDEIGKVFTVCQDAHAMRKLIYVLRAKHIQKDLAEKINLIHYSIYTHLVGQNPQLYEGNARALEQVSNMHEFYMAAVNEQKQLEELEKILELKDNEAKLAKLRENDLIQENADLQNIIRDLMPERDDLHQRVQQASPNSITFSKAKAEQLYMDQIFSLLNDVTIATPNNKTPPTPETASLSSESLQGILESCYCPISAQVMKDPVLPHCPECTQTCDRASLEQWFATGKTSCPLCGHSQLLSSRIRPNAALRNTIEACLQASGIFSGDHGGEHSSAQTGSPPKNGFKTHTYPDGERYFGEYQNDNRHGRGKCVFANGNIYDGEWLDDKKHGHCVFTWPTGEKYDGEYQNDNRHGRGKYVFANGNIYDGQWVDDQKHGHGVFTWPTGAQYVGGYQNDNRHGRGNMVYTDGIYDGQWVDGKKHGHGVYTWPDGGKYVGEWKNNKRHGRGKYVFASGNINHDGEWENDKPKKRQWW
jgi:hypothetical protein